jgi:hypothetical protein
MPKLTIIAGPGGSGKTWLCKKIAVETSARPFPEATNVGPGDERGRAGHDRLPELVVLLLVNGLDCVMDEAHLVNLDFRQEFRRFCDTHLLGVQQKWLFFERNVLACINNVFADWNKMKRQDQSRFDSLNRQLEVYKPPPLGEFPGHQKLQTVYLQPSPQFNDEVQARAWLSDMALPPAQRKTETPG